MISSIFFILWRLAELLFLIPMVGMLSYIIHVFVQANMLTPDFVLVIFIVTVLAAVWCVATLIFFASAKRSGWFLPFVDLAFFGAFIGSVVALRGIAGPSCSDFANNPLGRQQLQLAPFANDLNKVCGLLKASFAFAILEILMFATTFFWALLVERHQDHKDDNRSSREVRSSRRSHSRHRSSSRAPSTRYDSRSRRGTSRGGDRSDYYERRSYV